MMALATFLNRQCGQTIMHANEMLSPAGLCYSGVLSDRKNN